MRHAHFSEYDAPPDVVPNSAAFSEGGKDAAIS
jgi:hypothetical protein